MSIKTRLDRLERAGPTPSCALDELLAAVATRGLRVHERPADRPLPTRADPDELAAALDALRLPWLRCLGEPWHEHQGPRGEARGGAAREGQRPPHPLQVHRAPGWEWPPLGEAVPRPLVRLPAAPNETLERHESEDQAAFLERVRGAIRRIDPAEAEAFRWEADPKTDHTE